MQPLMIKIYQDLLLKNRLKFMINQKEVYNVNKEIRIKTSMLRSDLCDYSDAYIVVKGNIIVDKEAFTADDFGAPNNTAANANATNTANDNVFGEKKLIFKNNAPMLVKSDNAEDLDVVMLLYNLLEYCKNYRKTTGSLGNYYRDEPNSDAVDNEMKHSIINSKSFDYKANFIGSVIHNNLTKNHVKIVVPLKYLNNVWRNLYMSLINCEIELILTWFKKCVLRSKSIRDADYDAPIDRKIDVPENVTFQITDTKLHVPVVTLSKENDTKLLEQLKTGFKRTIKLNKDRSQLTVQSQNNNLN